MYPKNYLKPFQFFFTNFTIFISDFSKLLFKISFFFALKSGVFSTRLKVDWLVLSQKPGKPTGQPSSFWPLCMLDTIGKIFEQVIAERLRKHFRGSAPWAPTSISFNMAALRSMRLESWKSSPHLQLRSASSVQPSVSISNGSPIPKTPLCQISVPHATHWLLITKERNSSLKICKQLLAYEKRQ